MRQIQPRQRARELAEDRTGWTFGAAKCERMEEVGVAMKTWLTIIGGTVVAIGIVAAVIVYAHWNKAVPIAAMAINYFRYLSAPAGTIKTEVAIAENGESLPTSLSSPASTGSQLSSAQVGAEEGDWPSYNKTLTSDRYSQLSQINAHNVSKLKVLCTYDTGQYTGFTSGLLEVNGALIFTTEYDIFSIDPSRCHQNWRTHENYTPATPQGVNRGTAYLAHWQAGRNDAHRTLWHPRWQRAHDGSDGVLVFDLTQDSDTD